MPLDGFASKPRAKSKQLIGSIYKSERWDYNLIYSTLICGKLVITAQLNLIKIQFNVIYKVRTVKQEVYKLLEILCTSKNKQIYNIKSRKRILQLFSIFQSDSTKIYQMFNHPISVIVLRSTESFILILCNQFGLYLYILRILYLNENCASFTE